MTDSQALAYFQSLSVVDAIACIAAMGKVERDTLLCELYPNTCNHPICHDAFRCVKNMVDYIATLHSTKEFKDITKDVKTTADKIRTAEKLHAQRN